jgi:glutamate N-acetyltransferase / amino-acid N-acetyltransferase
MLHLLSPRGFRASSAAAGIKRSGKPDVALLLCDTAATAAALFTTNTVRAAPVIVGEKHVAGGILRGIVVNSGNANACTGQRGMRDAIEMCRLAGEVAGTPPRLILPSSTGIIGHFLPMEKIDRGITAAADDLGTSAKHAQAFSAAILTTDKVPKGAAVRFRVGKELVTLAGVCKGSGMIGPRLGLHATMLAYLTTDAQIPAGILRRLLAAATEQSFNAVTVDDHTSTNDTVAILASGLTAKIDSSRAQEPLAKGLLEVCQSLARQIAADGEGATKLVRVDVSGARTQADAKAMARAIANSPLVKCAMNGNDPNWGRIVSAAGMCGAHFDPQKSSLRLQGALVFRRGQPAAFDAGRVSRALAKKDVVVDLQCGSGKASATVWTCDLSREYVRINADYHT